ncbi:hypothetical protein Sjap_019231 [Stephania japonica]|uniref:J domain-containing protein n=1 Tax=Stephania japonica TaxID=461633 RepID=A0AAP0F171_9MAGN
MDGNKDEALKCLRMGKEALELGDRNRALKFITKARRLDPSLPVEDLLLRVEGEPANSADSSAAQSGGFHEASSSDSSKVGGGGSSVRQRGGLNGLSTKSNDYTEEQVSIVRQIKREKGYYEILGLEKSCSVEDVKKAYRKLSLKVHPDKNKAPGAEEAFKAVSKAFKCLSDEESRKKYDLVGSDEVEYERPVGRRGGGQGFNGFYEADFDPDEIFRNFFYGGMPGATTQFGGFTYRTNMGRGANVRTSDQGSGGFNMRAAIQLLPVLLLVLLNFLPSSEPVYSLSMNHPYVHRFSTDKHVPYYVKTAKFEQEYPVNSPQRIAIEGRVERDYFSILSQNCRVEMQRYYWGLIQETPNCDRLKQFETVA